MFWLIFLIVRVERFSNNSKRHRTLLPKPRNIHLGVRWPNIHHRRRAPISESLGHRHNRKRSYLAAQQSLRFHPKYPNDELWRQSHQKHWVDLVSRPESADRSRFPLQLLHQFLGSNASSSSATENNVTFAVPALRHYCWKNFVASNFV